VIGGRTFFPETLQGAVERMGEGRGDLAADPLTGMLYECYLCETLEMPHSELARWDWERAEVALGWAEGRMIGEWTQQNPLNGNGDG
jgi:hypothetical protein